MKRLLLSLVLVACGSASVEESPAPVIDAAPMNDVTPVRSEAYLDAPYATLAEYDLSAAVPYEVTNALFTDYAAKKRVIVGSSDLPTGTILVKEFAYGARKIETRLLIHARDGWRGHTYLWGEDQKEARLRPGGAIVELDTPKGHVTHLVPSELQCKKCHADGDRFVPIGLRVGSAHRDAAVKWDDPSSGTVAERARHYLDANCGHCHHETGAARTTGLWLRLGDRPDLQLGICKPPVAAGRGSADLAFDIVPGKPDESILINRMRSTEPQAMMPEIGRSLVHEEGVAVVAAWIASLNGDCQAQ
jgi:hypothetical protein